MKEKDILISHALDLKEKCASQSVVTSTNFFSVDELSLLIKAERINNEYVDTFYYGGFDEAERKIAIFIPKFYSVTKENLTDFINRNDSNPISLLKVSKDKFSVLSHRDYLGSLMGLGIKRELIGDILVNDNGCNIFCVKSISDFLCQNLKQAGRGQLNTEPCSINSMPDDESRFELSFLTVASLRLDCLVAAAFRLSRANAVNSITQGVVYVNSEQIFKPDYALKQGDKLVLRGRGKTVIEEILGESKKGRIRLNIKRFI